MENVNKSTMDELEQRVNEFVKESNTFNNFVSFICALYEKRLYNKEDTIYKSFDTNKIEFVRLYEKKTNTNFNVSNDEIRELTTENPFIKAILRFVLKCIENE